MAATRYQPPAGAFGPLLEDVLGTPDRGGARGVPRAPEADVVETRSEIQLAIDVPGATPEDVEISLQDNLLTISGERRAPDADAEGDWVWHLAERRFGRFSRAFVLPPDVEHERIQANYENGVLLIRIPKSGRAGRRRIEVRSGAGAGSPENAGDRA